MTKKEIKELYKAGKLKGLMNHIITDGTQSDIIDCLYLLFKKGGDSYEVTFESIPYSRGGKYRRHTSTLRSVQTWGIEYWENSGYNIVSSSSSKSGNCPVVIVPKFYTEKGKQFFNSKIENEINKLKMKLL